MKLKFLAGFLMICAALFFSVPAMAFTNVVTFGDSISDNGLYGVPYPNPINNPGYTNSMPWTNLTTVSDAYGFGSYTDGKPWADRLADMLDAEMFNAAYGGATTGLGNIYAPPLIPPGSSAPNSDYTTQTGLNWQVNNAGIQSIIGTLPLETTLFTVWAGANDYNRLNAMDDYNYQASLLGGPAYVALTAAEKQAAALVAVSNIIDALTTLAGLGVEHILVPNLMLLGDGNFTLTYNAALKQALALFEDTTGINIYRVNMFKLYLGLYDGYETATTDELKAAGLVWGFDGYHPGAAAHEAMAIAAANAVPVPGTMLLMVSGLIAISGISRRKTA